MVSEYRVVKWKRKKMFIDWEHGWIWRGDGGEEQADMDRLLATQVQGDVWVWVKSLSEAPKHPRGPVLMFVSLVTTKGHANVCSLGHHMGPCRCPRAMLPQWPRDRPRLLPRTISVSVVCVLWLISVTKDHTDAQGLDCNLRSGWYLRVVPPPGPRQFKWPALSSVAMVSSRPGLLLGPCLGPWSCQSQGLCWCSYPSYYQLWTVWTCDDDEPSDLKLQDTHDTGQQPDIQKESQWKSINNVAEGRGLKREQWLLARWRD